MPCSLTAVIRLLSQACCCGCCSPLLLPLCPGYQDSRPQSSKPSSLPKVTVVTRLLSLLSEAYTHVGSGADVTAHCFPPGRKQHRTLHAVLLDQQTRVFAIPWSWEVTLLHAVAHQPRPVCAPRPAWLLLPIWPTICGHLPLCYCHHPSNQPIALSLPSSSFLPCPALGHSSGAKAG